MRARGMGVNMAGRRRFKTICDCRRYLASLLNRLEAKELDPAIAGRCAYIANILIACIRDADLETRVKKIEEELKNES